jgi:hypothetical protein
LLLTAAGFESLPRMFREVSYALYFYPRINR